MLAELAGYAYMSLLPQFALVPMVLMIANQLPNLRRWMLAFGLALIMTSALSVFAPAVAAFVYLDLTPHRSMPTSVRLCIRTYRRLRLCGPARSAQSHSIISRD